MEVPSRGSELNCAQTLKSQQKSSWPKNPSIQSSYFNLRKSCSKPEVELCFTCSSIEHFRTLRSKRTLTALTRRRAAFAANKVAQILSLGLLYALIPVTQFSIYLANGRYSQSESHIVISFFYLLKVCAQKEGM